MTETELLRTKVRDPVQKAWPKAYVKKFPGTAWVRGVPDTWMVIAGQIVIVEGKKLSNENGNPTPQQRDNLLQADRAGALALCVVFNQVGRRWLVHEIRTYTAAEDRLPLLTRLEKVLKAPVRLADRLSPTLSSAGRASGRRRKP